MPIDDIPYLIQHSVKENIIVLIDSSTRDKLAWPTPGEFVIDFPEPFSLVFGIEIIHASIPRTMFMVDNHCNEIIFYCGWNDIIQTNTTYNGILVAKNYDSSDNLFFEDITDALESNIDINFYVDIDNSKVPKLKNRPIMKVTTSQPFIFDMDKSSASMIIGFNMLANSKEMFDEAKYIPLSHLLQSNILFNRNTIETRYNDPFTVQMDLQLQYTNARYYVTFELNDYLVYNTPYYIKNIKLFHKDKPLRILYSNIRVLSSIDDDFDPNEFETSPNKKITIDIYLDSFDRDIETINMLLEYNFFSNYHGKYNNIHKIFCSVDENEYQEDNEISELSSLYGKKITVLTFQFVSNATFVDNQSYWFYYRTLTDTKISYFKCVYNQHLDTFSFTSYLNATPNIVDPFNLLIFPWNFTLHFVDEDITTAINVIYIKYMQTDELTPTQYSITAPGLINLVNDNYVILKCDNIESQLQGSYLANNRSPGLGIFDINFEGYNMKNSNFISIDYKEFHPMGKLSKLHFRFERKNTGEIYDFKGVDLSFILSIKFYRPKSNNIFDQYTLNPNYNGNFIDYMNNFNDIQIKHKHDVYSDEDDDDDETDTSSTSTSDESIS